VEREQVRGWAVGADGGAGRLRAGLKLLLVGAAAVELAEVVEGDLGLGAGAERPGGGVAAQVAEDAVADAVVGDTAQRLLDLLDAAAEVGGVAEREPDGEEAGEPADGALELELGEERFAAVPFERDPLSALAG